MKKSLQILDTGAPSGTVDPSTLLRKYQWEGVSFLAESSAALLADEMGLGKTVQVCVALRITMSRPDVNKVLIVAPAALRLNWERELGRWFPGVAAKRVQGTAEDRAAYYQLPIPVLIASYDQIRTDVRGFYEGTKFDVVILDEAQKIKNRDSSTALACQLLERKVSWALTGTPIENATADLVSIFDFLMPRLVHPWMSRVQIHSRIRSHFLRRRKHEVLPELPPIIMQDLPLELEGPQAMAYQRLWDSRRSAIRSAEVPVRQTTLLALITRLKQICNFDPASQESVKYEALRVILDGLMAKTDKLIVFSQYVETLKWLSKRITDIPSELFHGDLGEDERDGVLNRFRSEPGPRMLLMSLQAGGVGLNLQEASAVVLFDRWWNPAVEEQAVQRAHRFGRERPLHVFRFLVTDTIEQRIAEVLTEKQGLFDEYVDQAESATPRGFSRDELRRLLGLSDADIEVEDQSTQEVKKS